MNKIYPLLIIKNEAYIHNSQQMSILYLAELYFTPPLNKVFKIRFYFFRHISSRCSVGQRQIKFYFPSASQRVLRVFYKLHHFFKPDDS